MEFPTRTKADLVAPVSQVSTPGFLQGKVGTGAGKRSRNPGNHGASPSIPRSEAEMVRSEWPLRIRQDPMDLLVGTQSDRWCPIS